MLIGTTLFLKQTRGKVQPTTGEEKKTQVANSAKSTNSGLRLTLTLCRRCFHAVAESITPRKRKEKTRKKKTKNKIFWPSLLMIISNLVYPGVRSRVTLCNVNLDSYLLSSWYRLQTKAWSRSYLIFFSSPAANSAVFVSNCLLLPSSVHVCDRQISSVFFNGNPISFWHPTVSKYDTKAFHDRRYARIETDAW